MQTLLTPAQVAERLNLSPAALRRLAVAYEAVHGSLPRPPGSPSRLWPLAAVEAVEVARVMVAEAQAQNIGQALAALAQGDRPTAPALPSPDIDEADLDQLRDVLAALVAEVGDLRADRAAQARELAELRALIAAEGRLTRDAVRAALTAPSAAQPAPRGLWARLRAWITR